MIRKSIVKPKSSLLDRTLVEWSKVFSAHSSGHIFEATVHLIEVCFGLSVLKRVANGDGHIFREIVETYFPYLGETKARLYAEIGAAFYYSPEFVAILKEETDYAIPEADLKVIAPIGAQLDELKTTEGLKDVSIFKLEEFISGGGKTPRIREADKIREAAFEKARRNVQEKEEADKKLAALTSESSGEEIKETAPVEETAPVAATESETPPSFPSKPVTVKPTKIVKAGTAAKAPSSTATITKPNPYALAVKKEIAVLEAVVTTSLTRSPISNWSSSDRSEIKRRLEAIIDRL